MSFKGEASKDLLVVGGFLALIYLGGQSETNTSPKDFCHVVDEKDTSISGIVSHLERPNSHTVSADTAAVVDAFDGNPQAIHRGNIVTLPAAIVPHLKPLVTPTADFYPCR